MMFVLLQRCLKILAILVCISPHFAATEYTTYVPIELKTCTDCGDKVVNFPPQRVEGHVGTVQLAAIQQTSSSVQLYWVKDGFAGMGFLGTPPVKTITAPCVCAANSGQQNTPNPNAAVDEIIRQYNAPHPEKISLPDLVQWHQGKVVLSFIPRPAQGANAVILMPRSAGFIHLLPPLGNAAAPQRSGGVVHLLPAAVSNTQALQNSSNASSSTQITSPSTPPTATPRTGRSALLPDNKSRTPSNAFCLGYDYEREEEVWAVSGTKNSTPPIDLRSTYASQEQIAAIDSIKINPASNAHLKTLSPFTLPPARTFTLRDIPNYQDYQTASKLPFKIDINLGDHGSVGPIGPQDSHFGLKIGLLDTARESINKARRQRWNEENAIMREYSLIAQIINQTPEYFTPEYFFREVITNAVGSNSSQGVPVDSFFDRFDLYAYDAFRTLLKRFPDYGQRILALQKRINANRKKFAYDYRLNRFHIWTDKANNKFNYFSLPEIIDHLAQEVKDSMEQARIIAQQRINQEFEAQLRAQYAAEYHATMARRQAALKKIIHEEKQHLDHVFASQRKLIAAQAKRTSDYEDYGNTRRVKINDAASYSNIFNKKSEHDAFNLCFPAVDNEPLAADACDDTLQHFIDLAEEHPNDPWHQQDAGAVQTMVAYFHEALETDPEQARRWEHRINALTQKYENIPIERYLLQLQSSTSPEETSYYQHNLEEAIKNKNTSCNAIRDHQYSTEFKNFLEQKGFPLERGHFYSNPVDWETGQIMRTMYETEQRYGNFYDVQHLHECTVWALEVARNRNSAEPRRNLTSYLFLDIAHAFANAARKMGELLIQAEDHEIYSGEAVQQLFGRTAQILGQHTKEIIKNPWPLATELALCAVLPAPINLVRLLAAALPHMDDFSKFFAHMNELIRNHPAEFTAQMAAFVMEFVITGKVIKNIDALSPHAQQFLKFRLGEGERLLIATECGIQIPIQTPITNFVAKSTENLKQTLQKGPQNFKAAWQTAKTAYTEAEIAAAKKIVECAEKLTPEIIQLRATRMAEWLKAVKSKSVDVAPAAANYQEIFDFIKPYFGGSLEGVFLDKAALKQGTLAMFRDTIIPGKAHRNRIQLRIGTKPKAGAHARAGEMVVNLEVGSVSGVFIKEFGCLKDKFQPYANGHLSVLHPNDLSSVTEKIKALFPVSP